MIKTKDLYISKKECCGCEQCTIVCPRGVLDMKPDDEGFLYPSIENADRCIDCKRCITICPLKSTVVPPRKLIKGFGGHASDEANIKKSASGGLSYALGRIFIESGGVVYGVRYSEDFHSAGYSRATTVKELGGFRTSKYFQAIKGNVFKQVKNDLKESKKVLFVGLSCEIAALYNFLSRDYDGLYTVSLICHGVTSPQVQMEFCEKIEKEAGSSIKSFSVRHKIDGWKPYYIKAVFENGEEYLKPFVATVYESAFKYLKRPSCSNCKFKLLNRNFGLKADLLIGDYHSQKPSDSFYNKWGTSLFYVCSPKGMELTTKLDDFDFSEVNIKGKEWTSPAISVPTKKLLFHTVFSSCYKKSGLEKASNQFVIKFASKYIQLKIKKTHQFMRKVQIRLFHRVYIW